MSPSPQSPGKARHGSLHHNPTVPTAGWEVRMREFLDTCGPAILVDSVTKKTKKNKKKTKLPHLKEDKR